MPAPQGAGGRVTLRPGALCSREWAEHLGSELRCGGVQPIHYLILRQPRVVHPLRRLDAAGDVQQFPVKHSSLLKLLVSNRCVPHWVQREVVAASLADQVLQAGLRQRRWLPQPRWKLPGAVHAHKQIEPLRQPPLHAVLITALIALPLPAAVLFEHLLQALPGAHLIGPLLNFRQFARVGLLECLPRLLPLHLRHLKRLEVGGDQRAALDYRCEQRSGPAA
eukprot:CAMPEP_0181183956 /NCGR_PEP_ID=MMETSP1096-20121128/8708_1 /TAXON_ID=156174 ORGANISM="Chrysochromulina ericina, Strain CCMP281" /NCGR_SAMPLE_ID=MMETSP1096 /ASSEMBLY_ACC=CAM_ASM_000453 /LENGTH=221 /DNA_ID=CAMNT_0023272683 /DNA_START=238 /DNA_END=899 /DNA_ORIENTATION=+